eukprot:1639840-Rhodomonas_salina.1
MDLGDSACRHHRCPATVVRRSPRGLTRGCNTTGAELVGEGAGAAGGSRGGDDGAQSARVEES